MMKNVFKRGYEPVREEKKRQDKLRERQGKRLWEFYLSKDGDEADIVFLTEEPITFDAHKLRVMRDGKERFDTVVCTKEGCQHCEDGDRPSQVAAYIIYDTRSYEATDEKGKKVTREGQIRLYLVGQRLASQLDRLSGRYGLTNTIYTVSKTGAGKGNVSYMYERGREITLSDKKIRNLLPEKLRDEYRGEDSWYDILAAQLETYLPVDESTAADDGDDDDEDDDAAEAAREAERKRRRNLVGDDDDDDEDEAEDDDDDEDDAPPAKSKIKPKTGLKPKTSAKPAASKPSSALSAFKNKKRG